MGFPCSRKEDLEEDTDKNQNMFTDKSNFIQSFTRLLQVRPDGRSADSSKTGPVRRFYTGLLFPVIVNQLDCSI